MPDPRERRGDEHTSPKPHTDNTADQPDRTGQPGDLASRDRAGKVAPRTPDQAEGDREDAPDIRKDHSPGATGDYSATKAPENREHVTSAEPTPDMRLKPGGAHGTPADVGMSGLYRENVPSQASDLGLTNYGENPARERKGTGKE